MILDLKSFEKYKKDISKKHFDLLKECKKERYLIRKIESFDFDVSSIGEDFDGKIVLFSSDYSIMNNFKTETKNYDSKIYTMYQEPSETIRLDYDKVFQFYRNITSKIKVILKDKDLEKNQADIFYHYHFQKDGSEFKDYFPYGEEKMFNFFLKKGMKKSLISKLKNFVEVSKEM